MTVTGTTRGHRRPWLPLALIVGLVGSTFLGGCAAHKVASDGYTWPPPPETGRIRYVRTLLRAADFEEGFFSSLRTFLLGEDHSRDVAYPTSVALSPDDSRLVVTSGPYGRVVEFDLVNHGVRSLAAAEGHRPSAPYGAAFDAASNLYVADQNGQKVIVFSPSDAFLREIGKGILVHPNGVAIDRKRQVLYVADPGTAANPRHVVQVFALDGRHLRTLGKQGSGPGEFYAPSYMTVAPDGTLYVTDSLNARVQIFDAEGTYLNQFGSLGDGLGQFGKPKGLALDSFGNIYVVDGQTAWVQIFNPRQQALLVFGSRAPSAEFLLSPNAIAISGKNEIFVADYTGRINEYRLINTTAEDSYAKPKASDPAPAAAEGTNSSPAPQPAPVPAPAAPPAAVP